MKDRHSNERALIDACIRHETRALHELFVRFYRAVYAGAAKAIARRFGICGGADDLTAQFFLRVVECPEQLLHGCASRSDLAPWLNALAYRQCSMILRSRSWRWPGAGPIAQTRNLDQLPASVHHAVDTADIIRRALEQLDGQSRALIEMRFGLGRWKQPKSIEQIAERMGCSYRTVGRQLREAIRQFRAAARAVQDNLDE